MNFLQLAVIFGVTAVKEGLDDLGRWRADKAANSRVYTVVRDGKEVDVPSKDIHVGDLLKLTADDEVRGQAAPGTILLVYSLAGVHPGTPLGLRDHCRRIAAFRACGPGCDGMARPPAPTMQRHCISNHAR